MKIIIKTLVFIFVFSLLFSVLSFDSECKGISNELLRIHILANSNSESDQQLKLMVRDRLLKDESLLLDEPKNKEQAISAANKNLKKIEITAEDELRQNGCEYNVKAEIVNMYFDTRYYENLTTPAGFYDALRITIGSGEGKNWWCVMFPPVCISAASADSPQLDEVLTEGEKDILENSSKYTYKFKIVEMYESFVNLISSH